MALPLPVVPGSADDAVKFISLEDYTAFFSHLDALFPGEAVPASLSLELALDDDLTLEIHEVGAFEASFVPSIADFSRLDERFRIAPEIWGQVEGYRDYGFAVFKLKKGSHQHVHPMALAFPTRSPEQVFFPTLHIHDGAYHPDAEFSHALFCQVDEDVMPTEQRLPATPRRDIEIPSFGSVAVARTVESPTPRMDAFMEVVQSYCQ